MNSEESELERDAREEYEHSLQGPQPAVVFVIFEKPPFAPLHWVVRLEIAYPGKEPVVGEPQLASTLEEARKFIPAGCERYDRRPGDPPFVVEAWI